MAAIRRVSEMPPVWLTSGCVTAFPERNKSLYLPQENSRSPVAIWVEVDRANKPKRQVNSGSTGSSINDRLNSPLSGKTLRDIAKLNQP